MIAYFKYMANFLMLLGAMLGALVAALYFGGRIPAAFQFGAGAEHAVLFYTVLFILSGIVIFRVIAAVIASKRLANIMKILFQDCEPQNFLAKFESLNEKIPHNLAEYMQGQVFISYAKAALGDFNGANAAVAGLEPEELRVHALPATSLVSNQRAGLCIMTGNIDGVEKQLEILRNVQASASVRAKTLAHNLDSVIRLLNARLNALRFSPDTDITYLEEEAELATNIIHKKQIQLELANFYLKLQPEKIELGVFSDMTDLSRMARAKQLLKNILDKKYGLYSEAQAEVLTNRAKKSPTARASCTVVRSVLGSSANSASKVAG